MVWVRQSYSRRVISPGSSDFSALLRSKADQLGRRGGLECVGLEASGTLAFLMPMGPVPTRLLFERAPDPFKSDRGRPRSGALSRCVWQLRPFRPEVGRHRLKTCPLGAVVMKMWIRAPISWWWAAVAAAPWPWASRACVVPASPARRHRVRR